MTPGEMKACRLYLGLTQRQMAEALGVTYAGICAWEEGSMAIRRIDELACMALMLRPHLILVNNIAGGFCDDG